MPGPPMLDPVSAERSYGIEATFRDNSGNRFSLVQRA